MKATIGLKIAVVMVLLVAVSLGSVTMVVSALIRSNVDRFTTDENLQIARARGDEIGELLRDLGWQVKILAERSEFRSGDKTLAEKTIQGLKNLPPAVINFLWADTTGAYMTSAGARGSIADRSYFNAVVHQGNELFISEAVVSKSLNQPIIVVAVPVKSDQGQVKGLMGAMVRLMDLSTVVNRIKVGQSGYGWVADKTGLILAHPNPAVVMNLKVTEADQKGYKGLSALGAEIIKGAPGSGTCVRPDGVTLITYFVPIPDSPGWMMGISMPQVEAQATEQILINFLLIFLAVGTLLAALVALFFARRLSRPIKATALGMREFSQGEADLRVRLNLKRNDEIGALAQDFNSFVSKLQQIIQEMKSAQDSLVKIGEDLESGTLRSKNAVAAIAQSVDLIKSQSAEQESSVVESASAVEQIARNIESLDQQITQQAASITQASASVEEMVGNISSIRESAERMSDQFTQLTEVAKQGQEIHSGALEKIAGIVARSESLLEANEVISGIASQTNLLAMNAAIEAAHAGEAGKGFSVVSDEIRKLAETSSSQSVSIGRDLKNVQQSIVEVLEASRLSEEAFEQVIEMISRTDELVRGVRSALGEQQEGSSQMLMALRDMNHVTAEVQVGSQEMKRGNSTILGEVERLRTGSKAVSATLNRVESDVHSITEELQAVDQAVNRTMETIESMEKEVGRFKV